jgi:hypothetical protein
MGLHGLLKPWLYLSWETNEGYGIILVLQVPDVENFLSKIYIIACEGVSIISGTISAICAAVLVAQCNGRWY